MRIHLCLIAAFVVTFLSDLAACERAAGVVAFTHVEEQTLILIADHKILPQRGWATFGGCADAGETIEQAALREFKEETRCVFEIAAIDEQTPRVQQGRFTSFAVEVAYQDADRIADRSAPNCQGSVFEERGPWKWVDRKALTTALGDADGSRPVRLPATLGIPAQRSWFWGKSATVIHALDKLQAFER